MSSLKSFVVAFVVLALLVAFVQPAFASNGNAAAGCDWRCQAARAKAWVSRDTAAF